MLVIQPNCRVQFTAEDVEFVVATLGGESSRAGCLVQLLADEESRDLILDDEKLVRALLENPGCLRVSSHFYFYALVRHVFRRAGIENRAVADYVAELLAQFSLQERTRCRVPGKPEPLDYFFEMRASMPAADDRTRFLIWAHMGNQSLFLTGIFPERIRARAERRGFPDLAYYEALGRSSFQAASDHRLARKYALGPIFAELADQFQTTSRALNDLTDRLFTLGGPDGNALLNQLN